MFTWKKISYILNLVTVNWFEKNTFWFLKLGLHFPFKTSLTKILIEANPLFYSLCPNKKLPQYNNGKLVTVTVN